LLTDIARLPCPARRFAGEAGRGKDIICRPQCMGQEKRIKPTAYALDGDDISW